MSRPPSSRPTRRHATTLALLLSLGAAPLAWAVDNAKAARYYEDALVRYERKDMAGAIIQLKNALQIDKSQLPVQLLLGRALLANNEPAGAEIAFGEALRLGVNRAEIVIPLAQALAAQGKQTQLLERPDLNPNGLQPALRQQLILLRAAAAADTGDLRNGLAMLDEARALSRDSAEVWLAEVPLRVRNRQFNEAMVAVDKALAITPASAEAHYQKGSVLHARGDIATALAAYARALQLDPAHTETRLARAGALIDLDRGKDAAADIGELLKREPNEPRGLYLKALLARRAGDAATANAALNEVTSLMDPVPIEYIRYRPQMLILTGMAHHALKEPLKAIPYLEAAHRALGPTPLAKLLAQIYLGDGKPDRAAEVLESYLRAQPGDGQALAMYASLLVSQGRHAKATSLMQQALRSNDTPEFRTVLGLGLLQSGQAASGQTELEAAFKRAPGQLQAGTNLISLYMKAGQNAKAIATADTLLKQHGRNPTVWTLQGIAKSRARDFAGARSSFQRALDIDRSLLEPKLGLVRVDIASGALAEADKRLAALLKEEDRNADILFEMASLSEQRKNPEEALRWLEKAVDGLGPGVGRAQQALVAWHLRAGQAAPALEAAKRLLNRTPEDSGALLIYARAQLLGGDQAGARNSLTQAARRAGYQAEQLFGVADLQLLAGDAAGAAYTLEKVLSTQPGSVRALAMSSSAELMRGDQAAAERLARQVLQQQPKLALGHSLLADVQVARDQVGPALDSLRRAHELQPSTDSLLRLFRLLSLQDGGKPAVQLAEQWLKTRPNDLAVRKVLGDTQARHGNFAAARQTYDLALKQSPKDAELLNNQANVLLRLNDNAAALKVAEAALAEAPRLPLVIDTAGWANFRAGRHDRALQLLRDARLREPGNAEIRYHLGAVLAAMGKKAEARGEVEVALKGSLAPDIAMAATALLTTLK
ncbi:PEP-CTERM system TPR-repeat protein PrsT [Roseateles sp. DAIF2]|uniref:XrtA/PEP-CTERM system TPR-repeat protein PrsT n=1 Tax=Roseateles sp. DAIF2 TaxID=2714952 RepID=UPI0018A302D2|nr:XrtA/PEP-CTERM system TPR-repeat protein PrsT [Roseateles sp. DAIF2]QPF73541.1 PEP-CTERM system TPR-repeat protein PrsT [Roseateles sp. DAIF2]